MSGIRAFDRAQDAYNLAKKVAVQTKVIVFVIPKPKIGASPQEIRFPYGGKVTEVYASCGKTGISFTRIQVEKCSQADYDSTPAWSPILASPLTLDANEKSTKTTSAPTSITIQVVAANDHFRINFSDIGSGVENLTLEITIAI